MVIYLGSLIAILLGAENCSGPWTTPAASTAHAPFTSYPSVKIKETKWNARCKNLQFYSQQNNFEIIIWLKRTYRHWIFGIF